MSCPKCHGSSVLLISPGFFQCTSKIEVRRGGPGLTDPRSGPPVLISYVECGHEWQEAASSSGRSCSCGIFAIGECQSCGKDVCGQHSRLLEGRLLCSECLAAEQARLQAEAQERQNEAERAIRERNEAALRVWCDQAAKDLQGHDPVEQLLRGSAGLVQKQTKYQSDSDAPIARTDAAHLLLPTWFGVDGRPRWTLHTVARWVADHHQPSGNDRLLVQQKTLFGYKKKLIPGWSLDGAATTTYTIHDSSPIHHNLAILPDGTVLEGSSYGWGSSLTRNTATNIRPGGLKFLAKRLGLRPITEPPPVIYR